MARVTSEIGPLVIIGTGLIGASIGCALTRAGCQVYLRDLLPSHMVVAAGRGAGLIEPVAPDEVTMVIVAVPPRSVAPTVAAALGEFPQAVVTDVASVKAEIEAELAAGGTDISRYIGGHPMAGSHHTGPLTAASELFVDRTWVLTPRAQTPGWVHDRARSVVALTRARVVEMDAGTHDRAVAEISHVPQIISSLAAAMLADAPQSSLKLAGQGVRDLTRIAASDVSLWGQIIGANRGPVLSQLMALRNDLDHLIRKFDQESAIIDVLTRGNQGVRALPSKRAKSREELVAVVVKIPDTPGSLARLVNAITETGINIEDLSIEHDLTEEVGYLSVNVAVERADGLRDMLTARGWA